MTEFRKILVATDFSSYSKRALEQALSLATPLNAQVDVLYVGMPVTSYGPLDRALFGQERTGELTKQVREVAEQAMEAFLADLPDRVVVGKRVEWGTPYELVTRIARQDGYDLIVVGSHGRTGAQHVLMGSVAERIARHAKCPVLTVR